jgi:hypothetical protein
MATWNAIHFKSVAAVLRREVDTYGDMPVIHRIADSFSDLFRESNGWFRAAQFFDDAGLTFRGVSFTLTEAEQFFYDHAPRGTWGEDETPDHARVRNAVLLADAEARLEASPDTSVEWWAEPSDFGGMVRVGAPLYTFYLYESGQLLGSALHQDLKGTPDDRPDQVRVVSAQLALEYLSR